MHYILGGDRALSHFDPTELHISHTLLKIYRPASSACSLARVCFHRARHNMGNETPLAALGDYAKDGRIARPGHQWSHSVARPKQ